MPRHRSSISEGSLVQPKSEGLRRPTKRKRSLQSTGAGQSIRQYSPYAKWPAVNQFLWEDTSRLVQIHWKPAFGSLYDGSCLCIGKDDTSEDVWGGTLPHRKTKCTRLELLQCCGSLLCFRSHKHRSLPYNRWLSNRVQHCLQRHEECAIHDGMPWPK